MIKIILILLLIPFGAQARVFDFTKEHVATYFKGNLGLTSVGKTAYEKSSGAGTSFDDQPLYNYGGEFGFLFTYQRVGFRAGLELINPQKKDGIEGKNSSGTVLMTLNSTVLGLVPSAHLEIGLSKSATARGLFVLGAGYGTVTILNDYTLTTAGQAAYPGISNFTEEGSGTAILGDVAFAYEFSFTDNIAMMLDGGYRYFHIPRFTHSRNGTTFLGAVSTGDVVKNSDGSNRSIDLSGPFVGIGFRFYLGI